MMVTLRSAAGNRYNVAQQRNLAISSSTMAAASSQSANGPSPRGPDPNACCKKCRHKHKNMDCYRQHPELAVGPKGLEWKENKIKSEFEQRKNIGKANAAEETEDKNSEDDVYFKSDEEGSIGFGASARTYYRNKIHHIYDTGASHHFLNSKRAFKTLYNRPTPFKFDQAVGATSLTQEGKAHINFGNLKLCLDNCLYSPNSSLNIISAGRLQRRAGIFADFNKNILYKPSSAYSSLPLARLVRKHDIYFIEPCHKADYKPLKPIATPGVVRVSKTTNTQRWHQRLGHIGQQILKKTAEVSKGLEGLDMMDLTTCETCHLSKAQRYISRELRPTPNDPLDEIFVDTVGKLSKSIHGDQYAVILTDAKTRMRWVLTASTKDEIAPKLIQWIREMNHQYGKIVRAIFRDGGTEFSKMQKYCTDNGIRTDVSAPDTPEQNGTSEAANKIVLRIARSMLIDAGMPPIYWAWALHHACFIINRLYCIRTKRVPIIDFLQGLRQPHTEKVDLTNLPRFGCRAYKLITPKPGKFQPRAVKGWFVGFQANTNKNFLIFHPHYTPRQGWKWIKSFTPHTSRLIQLKYSLWR